jgi:hypothetical protein
MSTIVGLAAGVSSLRAKRPDSRLARLGWVDRQKACLCTAGKFVEVLEEEFGTLSRGADSGLAHQSAAVHCASMVCARPPQDRLIDSEAV